MSKYKIESNYGTFELSKVVEAEDFEEAYSHCGIVADLRAAGWDVDGPDGEYHTIFMKVGGQWIECEDDVLLEA